MAETTRIFSPQRSQSSGSTFHTLALVRAHSPAARRAQLRLGSNDSVVVWLNGKKVHDNNILRTARIDEDVVDVELEAGENELLVKVCQTALDWGFYFRITDREGRALEDLRYGRE